MNLAELNEMNFECFSEALSLSLFDKKTKQKMIRESLFLGVRMQIYICIRVDDML